MQRRKFFFCQLHKMAAVLFQGFCLGLIAASFASSPAMAQKFVPSSHDGAAPGATAPESPRPKLANFQGEHASADVQQVAGWVVNSEDNRSLPFAIVDKQDAKVFVFDGRGQLLGAAPALVGLAKGDDSVPGIGDKPLADIGPEERTTPAGRFVASLGSDLGKLDVLWVDYKDAISLHRVITTNPKERRLQRLATATPLDNRISYGCINVPAKFFDRVVQPAFTGTNGIVYVLPEIRTLHQAFPAYYDAED